VLTDLFPGFNLSILSDLASIQLRGLVGVVSAVLLLWSMTPFSGALRNALGKMFKMPLAMPFYLSKLIDMATVFCFLLLFVLLAALKVFLPEAGDGAGWAARMASGLLRALVPFLLSVGFIGLFFRVFSPVRLSWRQWLLGAVTVVLLWALMRNLFIAFV